MSTSADTYGGEPSPMSLDIESREHLDLMADLRDAIVMIEEHLRRTDDLNLHWLETKLPRKAKAGSAEMVMLLLIYREMENRRRR